MALKKLDASKIKAFLMLSIGWCALFFPLMLQAQGEGHPRIYTTEQSKAAFLKSIEQVQWKKKFVEKKIQNLEKYLDYCKKDTNWLRSRLQMNWKTAGNNAFLDWQLLKSFTKKS